MTSPRKYTIVDLPSHESFLWQSLKSLFLTPNTKYEAEGTAIITVVCHVFLHMTFLRLLRRFFYCLGFKAIIKIKACD